MNSNIKDVKVAVERSYNSFGSRWLFARGVSWGARKMGIRENHSPYWNSGTCKDVFSLVLASEFDLAYILVNSRMRFRNFLVLCRLYGVKPVYFSFTKEILKKHFVIVLDKESFWMQSLFRVEFLYMVLRASDHSLKNAKKFWYNSIYNNIIDYNQFHGAMLDLPSTSVAATRKLEKEIMSNGICEYLKETRPEI